MRLFSSKPAAEGRRAFRPSATTEAVGSQGGHNLRGCSSQAMDPDEREIRIRELERRIQPVLASLGLLAQPGQRRWRRRKSRSGRGR